ncbi:ADP-ribosylation factor-related protein 1-like [Symsagittifera roscoffensis]|uniref:ADP-ribosylation factor-related protein 1-like n=1 Tax=Symsagittifera roscoffensis TaxID=84072 RepID=UPI00307B9C48
MYTLVSGLVRELLKRDEYNVLILGLDNAGKTTLLEHTKIKFTSGYTGKPFHKITATIGLNIGNISTLGVNLLFWDLGGQDELQSLWDKYYAECHGVVWVVDSLDEARVDDSRVAFEKMIRNEHMRGVPLLFLCNKQDMVGCLNVNQIREAFSDSASKMGSRDCSVRGVSALHGQGIKDAIVWLAQCVIKNNETRPPINKDD